VAGHHEAASKFLSQKISRLNIQQAEGCMAFRGATQLMDFFWPIRFNGGERRVSCERN
jgi:hypothetical protein